MYSEEKILERLLVSTKVLGWRPEYHSVDEVQRFTDQMKKLEYVDPKNPSIIRIVRDPTPKEQRWIQNEIHLCACDADYFLTRYGYIRDDKNSIIRFNWRASQRVYYRILQRMEAKNYSLEMQILKARQQGISTIIEGLISHRVITGYGVNAVAASSSLDQSVKMSGMMFLLVDMCPWWLKPTEKQRKEGKYLSYMNGCSIMIHAGSQIKGIARGSTPTVTHLSELADFDDPVALVEESLFKAVHPSPKVFLMLESTGNSNVGWWADTWRFNKANYASGRARLKPLFLPWFMATDLYPTYTWLLMHPIPEGWRPLEETMLHATKCEAYVASTDILREELGMGWRLPKEQAWFWEVNYQEHKAKGIARSWLQEMPADDVEALQSKNKSVIAPEIILSIETRRDKGYELAAVIGEGVEDKHQPMESDIDNRLERIPIIFDSRKRNKQYHWELVPLNPAGRQEENFSPNNKLLIFEPPLAGCKYSVAVDTAGGGGGDNLVISVDKVGDKLEQDVQVAEFASDNINAAEAYPFAMAISCYYGQTELPKFAAEQIRKPGDIVQVQLIQMGYPISRMHHMIRYDGKKLNKSKATKLGWYTYSYTRALLLTMFTAAVENGWYKINSRYLKEELSQFEARETESGLVKMEHMSGKHDDRIFAAAISYFIVHDLDVMIERSKVRYDGQESKLPELIVDPVRMNVVGFSQIWGKNWQRLVEFTNENARRVAV